MIAFLIISIFLFSSFPEKGNAQYVASSNGHKSVSDHSNQLTVTLDPSSLINSNYSTFYGYSVEGAFQQAAIQIIDDHGTLIKEFSLEPNEHGAISIPAHLLNEGNYKIQMIVDGRTTVVHNLRAVR